MKQIINTYQINKEDTLFNKINNIVNKHNMELFGILNEVSKKLYNYNQIGLIVYDDNSYDVLNYDDILFLKKYNLFN